MEWVGLGSGAQQIEVWDVKERGMFISYDGQEKKNRGEKFWSGGEGNEESLQQVSDDFSKTGTKTVYLWKSGEKGGSGELQECGKVEYAVGNALGS